PAVDPEMLANFLDVGDEVPGRVLFERCVRRTLSAAALVEVHDAIFLRVEKSPLFGLRSAAGSAVDEHDRLARGVAALFEIDLVKRRDSEPAGVVVLDRWIEPGDWVFHWGLGRHVIVHREQYTLSGASEADIPGAVVTRAQSAGVAGRVAAEEDRHSAARGFHHERVAERRPQRNRVVVAD